MYFLLVTCQGNFHIAVKNFLSYVVLRNENYNSAVSLSLYGLQVNFHQCAVRQKLLGWSRFFFTYLVIRSDTKLNIKNRRVPCGSWHIYKFEYVGCKTKLHVVLVSLKLCLSC